MSEVAVTEKLEDARPTDEQATAFLNGDRQAVEPQKPEPQEEKKVEAPASAASPAPVQKTETELLKQELNRIKSELGQLRKRGSESPKPVEQRQTPQSWAAMSPEQQAQWRELFQHTFQETYGNDFEQIKSFRQQQEVSAQATAAENYAREVSGDLFEKLNPIMGRMYEEIRAKAQDGDEEAERDLYEIGNTKAGIRDLVARARQEYSQGIEAKGDAAKAAQAEAAKKAGVTLGSTPQAAPKPDILKNLPDDPAEAAKVLKKEIDRRLAGQ